MTWLTKEEYKQRINKWKLRTLPEKAINCPYAKIISFDPIEMKGLAFCSVKKKDCCCFRK